MHAIQRLTYYARRHTTGLHHHIRYTTRQARYALGRRLLREPLGPRVARSDQTTHRLPL